jgi:hypothetical protein
MRRVAVVYDLGATPMDILTSLDEVAEPVFVLPQSEHNRKVADALRDVAEVVDVDGLVESKPDGITTFSDFQMDTTARLAESLGLPFHSPTVARDITRKHRQRRILNAHGVGNVATALVVDRDSAVRALDTVGLPAVLKPNRGVGGMNTYVVESPEELMRLVARLVREGVRADDDGYVLEARLVPTRVEEPWGGFVSVESLISGGRVRHLGVTGKFALGPPLRERGGYVPPLPGMVDEAALFDLTGRALSALGACDSVCHTEIMITEAGPEIIEVNGRAGGNIQDLFLRGHDVNLIELAARVALGEDPEVRPAAVDGVVFHYFGLAPTSARRLDAAPGLDAARALPEVDLLDLRVPVGSTLDWRRGFMERIYACRGRILDHDELAVFLPRLERLLDMRYDENGSAVTA